MPEGAHPLPPLKGWQGTPPVDLDGQNWSLPFAAKILDIPEKDLRKLVRKAGLEPSGTIRMAAFSRQGRNPRAYPAAELIRICEGHATSS